MPTAVSGLHWLSMTDEACPCGSKSPFAECCEPFIDGRAYPDTAEKLMRSRYSAFAVFNEQYLLDTWHPATRPSRVRMVPDQRWIGLSIKHCEAGQPGDEDGTVEFVARFKLNGKGHRLHETSRFNFLGGRWYYRDGEHHD